MNQRKFLTGIAIASFLVPSIGFTTISSSELAVAVPVRLSKNPQVKPFNSQAGRFSIDFPGKPTSFISKNPVTGQSINGFQVLIPKQASYLVGYQDIPSLRNASREAVRKMFSSNEFVTELLKPLNTADIKTKILNSKSIQMGNNLGQEIDLAIDVTRSNKTVRATGRCRTYIVGERNYILFIMNLDGSQKKNSAFFDSFRVYEKSEML